MAPEAAADHNPTATEAYTLSSGPAVTVSVPKRLDSAGGGGTEIEIQSTVSDHAVLMIVLLLTNYSSFSTCLWPPIVHYRPRCPMP